MTLGASEITHARTQRAGAAKPVSLALQGGGAHGAFAWGVLDHFLEDGRIRPTAISGASAGAMNAVNVAQGLLLGGPEEARDQLERFWTAVARAGALFNPGQETPLTSVLKGIGVDGPYAFLDTLSRLISPYDRAFFDFNPLRDILSEMIDFERLQRESPLALFVAATPVRTGNVRVFDTRSVTLAVVMASACLPSVYKAVEIDGEAHWDGGYSANPPLLPLVTTRKPDDIVIVHINPLVHEGVPTSAEQIMDRLNEISFNAPLLAELRTLAHAERRYRPSGFARLFGGTPAPLRVHSVRADSIADLSASSKLNTDLKFLMELRDRGRDAAADWLDRHWSDVGRRSSVDLHAEYLQPTHAPATT